MLKRLIYIILLLSFGNSTYAQLQPLLDQYHLNGLAINPAYAGSQEALSVGLYSRVQWVGFESAPKTFTFSMHSPMRNKKVNLGLIVLTDRLGSKAEAGFLFNYAYRIDLGSGKLSFGLAAGLTNISYNLNSIRYTDPGDVLLQDPGRRALLPAFSLGSYYYFDKFYVGVSMPLLTNHQMNQQTGKYHIGFDPAATNYNLITGYLFSLSEKLEMLSSLMFRSNPAIATQLDLHCNLIYKKKVSIGTIIRTNGNLSAILQIQANRQLRIGYSYGYELSELSSYQHGLHEVVLQYNFRYIVDVVNPRYF
jgi:type IX secretion system PorP/SprF family membrane protein